MTSNETTTRPTRTGRPLSGSVRRRGDVWSASVPREPGSTKRMERSFDTEDDAQRWLDDQIVRLNEGLPPVEPRRVPNTVLKAAAVSSRRRAPESPSFEDIAWRWHSEYYHELENAGAERAKAAGRNLELHIIPVFGALLSMDAKEGHALVKDWIRAMSGRKPLTPGSPLTPMKKGYSRQNVSGYLWLLKSVLDHAPTLGYAVPDYVRKVKAMKPLGARKRTATLLDMAMTAEIAKHLNVIHQLAVWLMRTAGMRISEVYGLKVANVIIDEHGHGYLAAGNQGGRGFLIRDDDGTTRREHHKEGAKTEAGIRLIAMPAQLTELVQVVIASFHTDSNGAIDLSARLVPSIQSSEGGQAGLRTAITKAAEAVAGVIYGADGDPDDLLVPHDFRKHYGTDMAWSDGVTGLLARRQMGHRAGNDVFDLVYTLDPRHMKYLRPAAEAMEAEISEALVSLMIPTTSRPLYGKAVYSVEELARINCRLEEVGWQRDDGDGIGTSEVAALLGIAETTARRLFENGDIPAERKSTHWVVQPAAVEAYLRTRPERLELVDLAAELGLGYHQARSHLLRLGFSLDKVPGTRQIDLTDAHVDALRTEMARIEALKARSMPAAEARHLLGVALSTVDKWLRKGDLVADPESDGSTARYITRTSVEAQRAKRPGRATPSGITVQSFSAATGLNDDAVRALIKAKHLTWAGRSRNGRLTNDSVQRYITGFRPELLDSPILAMADPVGSGSVG